MNKRIALARNVRDAIDAHLAEIDQVLRKSGTSRPERQTVCDEVESLIFDKLSKRCSDSPAVADVDALLAEMDSPSSFSAQDCERPPLPATESKILPLAVVAALTAVLGIIGAFIWAEWRGTESDRQQAAIIAFLITLLSLAMGVTAIQKIRRNARVHRGYLLAFIGVISLPICFCLWASRELAYPINTQLANEVHDYRRWKYQTVTTANGELVTRDREIEIAEGEVIIRRAEDKEVELPFVPWITTARGARLFSNATCFGPTILLTLVSVPLCYRRYHPKKLLK